jgi:hypothetical protein
MDKFCVIGLPSRGESEQDCCRRMLEKVTTRFLWGITFHFTELSPFPPDRISRTVLTSLFLILTSIASPNSQALRSSSPLKSSTSFPSYSKRSISCIITSRSNGCPDSILKRRESPWRWPSYFSSVGLRSSGKIAELLKSLLEYLYASHGDRSFLCGPRRR